MIKTNEPAVTSFYSVFIMQCRVLLKTTLDQLKVFYSIVVFNAIFVVNNFFLRKISTNVLLHNKPMLIDIVMPISVWMVSFKYFNGAIFRTTLLDPTTFPIKMITSKFFRSKVLFPHRSGTLHRAKMVASFSLFFKVAWVSLMQLTTNITNKCKFFNCFWSTSSRHIYIVSRGCSFVNKYEWRVVNHV